MIKYDLGCKTQSDLVAYLLILDYFTKEKMRDTVVASLNVALMKCLFFSLAGFPQIRGSMCVWEVDLTTVELNIPYLIFQGLFSNIIVFNPLCCWCLLLDPYSADCFLMYFCYV